MSLLSSQSIILCVITVIKVSTSCDDKARDDTHQQTESLIMSQDLSTRLLSYLVIILTVTQGLVELLFLPLSHL